MEEVVEPTQPDSCAACKHSRLNTGEPCVYLNIYFNKDAYKKDDPVCLSFSLWEVIDVQN